MPRIGRGLFFLLATIADLLAELEVSAYILDAIPNMTAETVSERVDPFVRALRAAYNRLVAEGVSGLHYVPDNALLGGDGEGTVDGRHPTDLGFQRFAEALEPVLRTVLGPGPE
jgi:lysophospholipase L1-like esterase